MEAVLFYIISAIILGTGMAAVASRHMMRSVIFLLFALLALAGLYFLVDFNFLGAVQLTVYAGGIVVLIIFSVLLIHHIESKLSEASNNRKWMSALLSLGGALAFIYVIIQNVFPVYAESTTTTTKTVGEKLLDYGEGGFILPFEVISLLLLASMIGAIVIAKGEPKQPSKPNEQ